MAETVYVRFPDGEKDDPDTDGQPNAVKIISAHKLDEYRARGFVQCQADGSALASVMKAGESEGGGAKPAGLADDPVAQELQGAGDTKSSPRSAPKAQGGRG